MGEQSSPSVAQAKRLHELDKEGKLNGDVIDGILSEEKKEDRGVIISTAPCAWDGLCGDISPVAGVYAAQPE